MSTFFTSSEANALKETLEDVITDKTEGTEPKVLKRFCRTRPMKDAYVDWAEYGGPGLATEKPEGQALTIGSINAGATTRMFAKTFGRQLVITREAMEDCKYEEVIKAARRLRRSVNKAQEIDASLMLARGFDTNYTGGDGQPLWSASHTLPGGGTYSNLMATPMSPSTEALIVASSQIKRWPSQDGLPDFYRMTGIVYPTEQHYVWLTVVKSEKTPVAGNFAEINVANSDMNLELIENVYWSNTTTNWCVLTDADEEFVFGVRRALESNNWIDNANQVLNFSASMRWGRIWTGGRCSLGVQA